MVLGNEGLGLKGERRQYPVLHRQFVRRQPLDPISEYQISGAGFRVSDFGFRVSKAPAGGEPHFQ